MGGEAGDVATEPSPDETEAAADETCDFANSADSADFVNSADSGPLPDMRFGVWGP